MTEPKITLEEIHRAVWARAAAETAAKYDEWAATRAQAEADRARRVQGGLRRPETCSIPDCGGNARAPGAAKGYCLRHYVEQRKYGAVLPSREKWHKRSGAPESALASDLPADHQRVAVQ